jgi:hypothetical protein
MGPFVSYEETKVLLIGPRFLLRSARNYCDKLSSLFQISVTTSILKNNLAYYSIVFKGQHIFL